MIHLPIARADFDKERLLERVHYTTFPRDPWHCWNWMGYRDKDGYGRVYTRAGTRLVHRVFFTLYHGPIPEGYEIDHTCYRSYCVSPFHLNAVSPEEHKRLTAEWRWLAPKLRAWTAALPA
jgi:hypothetical protein